MSTSEGQKGKYRLGSQDSFVIENYNHTKPFSNFFPGIAGVWGIPMWVFYVNRGQCISSFGIQSKDKAILEFQPANKAYRLTTLQGFRTFLKVRSGSKAIFWEPFQNNAQDGKTLFQQKMSIRSHDLIIQDTNPQLGLKVEVKYFTLAQEPLAALVREVTVTNVSNKKLAVEMIDGLPVMNCYGINDWAAKNMSRTVEAWINISNIAQKVPYYHLKVEVADTPQIQHIKEGNFYFSYLAGERKGRLLDPIVEAAHVFGSCLDFRSPERFIQSKKFRAPRIQQTSNKTPSAMGYGTFILKPREEIKVVSHIGFAYGLKEVNNFATKALDQKFTAQKEVENRAVVDSVKSFVFNKSSSPVFDAYCGQTFLDNVLRGGLPISLKTQEGAVAFNVYSRKHGDLERDYNFFVLAPTYFSQGNGNYRDVNQNRRNDVWFNLDVRDTNVHNFINLLQADGYNPLIVKGVTFVIESTEKIDRVLEECVAGEHRDFVKERLQKPFQPGELINAVIQKQVKLKVSVQDFLGRVLSAGHKQEQCDHGEGFWVDHWTYNLDLLESFLSVYPEELRSLLIEDKSFTFYHNSHYVLPRDQRYILTDRGVRQYHSVCHDAKGTRADMHGNRLRTRNGEGDVYQTNLLTKLLCLAVNKVSSLDPSGIGMEMEADKPGWYDALNGLPGLLGSSISETFELKRLCLFIKDCLSVLGLEDDQKVSVFAELYSFISRVTHQLMNEADPLQFWIKTNDVKEHYRYRIRQGIEGQENDLTIKEIRNFLDAVIQKTTRGINEARNKNGPFATYFYYEVVEYEKLNKFDDKGHPLVKALKFKRHDLPLFLEGFVHALRTMASKNEAKGLYQKVRSSALFDKKLKMYKVNADLSRESEEIGRTRIFPRGWLENESIWLHMEYKFLLELLRNGLFEEYYENLDAALIPFLAPKQYGRSVLENSSFIVSSAHGEKSLHGQGFVARLSGSTAEFLHMWLLMVLGPRPFRLNEQGELTLHLQPALRGALFTRAESVCEWTTSDAQKRKIKIPKNAYAFNLFASTLVVYHNPGRKDTFGPRKTRIKKICLEYAGSQEPVELTTAAIPSGHARAIRQMKVERIDVYFE